MIYTLLMVFLHILVDITLLKLHNLHALSHFKHVGIQLIGEHLCNKHLLIKYGGFVEEKVEVVLRADLSISLVNGTFERPTSLPAHLSKKRSRSSTIITQSMRMYKASQSDNKTISLPTPTEKSFMFITSSQRRGISPATN